MSTRTISSLATGKESHIRVCSHCGMRYDWRRSPSSSLKMTYCGTLCERADLGFTLDALLAYTPTRRSDPRFPEIASKGDGSGDYADIGTNAEALAGLIAA